MTLESIWRWLTTSRYTRLLERENDELRARVKEVEAENRALVFALGRRPTDAALVEETERAASTPAVPAPSLRRQRPGKFQGFSQAKKQLESQSAPTQRSVS